MAVPIPVNKWAPGTSYGPVLPQTDLYLLSPELEIHPILQQKHPSFRLVLNISTGMHLQLYIPHSSIPHRSRMFCDSSDQIEVFFEGQSQDGDGRNEFTAKEEPAVLPRVDQLYIISEHSPWCTTVRNEKGVTLSDVCSAIWQEYTNNYVTDAEMASLSARGQEQVKRAAQAHQAQASGTWAYAPHAVGAVRCRRVDWFKDRIYFEGMRRDDRYAQNRLGFKAPNIFVMDLTNF